MEKIQISFTEKQIQQLNAEKERLGSSMASIIRNALTQYFERNGGVAIEL